MDTFIGEDAWLEDRRARARSDPVLATFDELLEGKRRREGIYAPRDACTRLAWEAAITGALLGEDPPEVQALAELELLAGD